MVVGIAVVVFAQGHFLLCDSRHHTRRHNLKCLDIVQADDVLDDLVLILLNHTFLLADVSHGADLLTRDGVVAYGVLLVEHTGQIVHQQHKREHDNNQRTRGICRESHQ